MNASRRRRRRSSRAVGRLVLGLLLGEVIGATAGLLVGVRRHHDDHAEITKSYADYASGHSRLSAAGTSDTSDDDTSDPLVAWPLVGLAAGAIVGIATAVGYGELLRLLRQTRRRVADPGL
jgi:hypothetical protein